jgi:hypothetical protein
MCENFKQFIGVLFLLIFVIPIVVLVWVPYVSNLVQKLNEEVKSEPGYISSYQALGRGSPERANLPE